MTDQTTLNARINRIQDLVQRAEKTNAENAIRLDAIEIRHEWCCASGWTQLRTFSAPSSALNLLALTADRIGRDRGLAPNSVRHALRGTVTQWPCWIWDAAAEELGWSL